MRTISITIPTYEMHGLGAKFLEESFVILQKQTYKDFDVVISDHSQNDEIENLCKKYSELLDIKYIRNTEKRGNSSANLNNAIKQATGKLIKILFQDDFLFDEKSLEKIVKNFDLEKDSWLVSACEHSKDGKNFIRPFYPKYNHKIHLGKNTISSPSVLTIKNDSPLLFDENLLWLMDCEYYRKCYDAFGDPKILKTITVVNRVGKHQITKTLATIKIRKQEKKYMIKKFGKKGGPLSLPKVTLVAVSSVKIKETIDALSKSMRRIKYAEVLFLTHEEITLKEKGIEVVKIPKLDYLEYSRFILYELRKYINSEFVLVVQHDGYVLRPSKWNKDFLNYDYIGAPWRKDLYFTKSGENIRVGNGGFSLRSKKLLELPSKLEIPFHDNNSGFFHEDGFLCVHNREFLEQNGIKFAPVQIASSFSRERWCKDSKFFTFGFHSNRRNLPIFVWKKIKKILNKK